MAKFLATSSGPLSEFKTCLRGPLLEVSDSWSRVFRVEFRTEEELRKRLFDLEFTGEDIRLPTRLFIS